MDIRRPLAVCLAVCAIIATLVALPVTPASGDEPPAVVGGTFHPLDPVRILDTRPGELDDDGFNAKIAGGTFINFPVLGKGGIPESGVSAVVLNATATNPTVSTFLTVWPAGRPRPVASNLNPAAGQSVPNLVEVAVGDGGAVSIYNHNGTADVILDVAGWVGTSEESTNAGLFHPLSPSRLLDTRDGTGQEAAAAIGPGGKVTLQVAGVGGVPDTGVSAVALNLTITQPTESTFITAYPGGATRPLASNLNATPGRTIANRAHVKLGPAGTIELFNLRGNSHLVVDVNGWFSDGSVANSGARFVGITPTRLLDTRDTHTPLGGGGLRNVGVAGLAGLPAATAQMPATAAVLNITSTGANASSFLTAFPHGVSRPLASDLNWTPGRTVPNFAVVKLGADGSFDMFNNAGSTDLIVDLLGYYIGDVVLQPGLHVLDEDETIAITEVTPTSITFDGIPADLADIEVGDTLNAGISQHTPEGLMRKVTAIGTTDGNLVLTTVDASLDQLIESGSLHVEPEQGTGVPPVPPATQSVSSDVPTGPRRDASLDPSITVNLVLPLDGKPPDESEAKAEGQVTVALHLGLDLDLRPDGIDFSVEAGVHVSVDAKLTIMKTLGDIQKCLPLPSVRLSAFATTIGPVILVFWPSVEPKICADGQVQIGLSGGVSVSGGVAFGIDHHNGQTTTHTEGELAAPQGAAPDGQFVAPQIAVSIGVVPEVAFTLAVNGLEIVEVGPKFDFEVDFDKCNLHLWFRPKIAAALKIDVWRFEGPQVGVALTLGEYHLLELPIVNCAYWTGTITERVEDHNYSQPEVGNDFSMQRVWTMEKPEPFAHGRLVGELRHTETGRQGQGCHDPETGQTVIKPATSWFANDTIDLAGNSNWGVNDEELLLVAQGERPYRSTHTGFNCDGTSFVLSAQAAFPDSLFRPKYALSPTGLSSRGSAVILQDTNASGGTFSQTVEWDLQKQCSKGEPTSC